jgi:hypothetical protein
VSIKDYLFGDGASSIYPVLEVPVLSPATQPNIEEYLFGASGVMPPPYNYWGDITGEPSRIDISGQPVNSVFGAGVHININTSLLPVTSTENIGKYLMLNSDGENEYSEVPEAIWGNITGNIEDQEDLVQSLNSKEDSLGNPSVDDYLLSSKTDGTRVWVEPPTSAEWGSITGDIEDQADLVEYIEDNTPDPIITSDIISTVDVGAIAQAQTIAEGTTLTQFVQALLMQTYYPTYVTPSATLTINISSTTECGHQQAGTLTVSFNRGQIKGLVESGIWNPDAFQNHRAGAVNYYLIDGTNTGTTNTKSLGTYTVQEGTNSFSSTTYYLVGPQPLDSLGNPYETPLAAGFITANRSIYGRRRCFHGTTTAGSPPSSSSDVRGLASSVLNPANNTNFNISIPVGAVHVCFAYPATLRDVSSVKYVEGLNAEIKDVFTKTTFNVEGANGYTAISYKVYSYTPVEPFGETATYNVTI